MDDIQSGSNEKGNSYKFKKVATMTMAEGSFQLYKWHCNIPNLEERDYRKEINTNDTVYPFSRQSHKMVKQT